MKLPQFSLRELFWLTLAVCLGLGWLTNRIAILGIENDLRSEVHSLQSKIPALEKLAGIRSASDDEKQRAVKAAELLLQREGYDWGEAIHVRPAHWNTLVVEYATPAEEQRLLGDRSVVVHREDWHASNLERE